MQRDRKSARWWLVAFLAAALAALFLPAQVSASRAGTREECTPATCGINLTFPTNSAVLPYSPGRTVNFSWFVNWSCGGTDCGPIEVKIASNPGMSAVVQDKYVGDCNPYCPMAWTSAPLQAGTYYWQVTTGANLSDVNTVSLIWSFTLGGQGSAPAPGSATFQDSTGDSKSGYDITSVTVSNDVQPSLHFAISVPSKPALAANERVVIRLDTDVNANTGNNGWDEALCTCGANNTQMEWFVWNGSGWWQAGNPPSLRMSYGGGWSVDVLATELGLGGSFRFNVGTGIGDNVGGITVDDDAPDSGSWTYTIGGGGGSTTACSPDTTPPAVHALPSNVPAGGTGHLRYQVSDNCGQTSDHIVVYSHYKAITRITTRLSASRPGVNYYVTWHVPRRARLPLTFCVVAFDAAGNASRRSCARISVY